MFAIGDMVRILSPFNEPYSGEYVIERIEFVNVDTPVYFLTGIEPGFNAIWLEAV